MATTDRTGDGNNVDGADRVDTSKNGETTETKQQQESSVDTPTAASAPGTAAAVAASAPAPPVVRIHPLDRRYRYQNRWTGHVSATPFTARQICRMLCPVHATASASSTTAAAVITPETQLLAIEDDGVHYAEEGWKPAKEIPVIREAVASWHYEQPQVHQTSEENGADGNDVSGGGGGADGSSQTTATQITTTTVAGPITCRALADLPAPNTSNDNNDNGNRLWKRYPQTRVYEQTITDGTWKSICELPNLTLALQAFETITPPVSTLSASQEVLSQEQQQQHVQKEEAMDLERSVRESDHDHTNNAQQPSTATTTTTPDLHDKQVQDELEHFLSSTDRLGNSSNKKRRGYGDGSDDDDDDDDESYQSDGGTRYIRDHTTGKWIHEALMTSSQHRTKKSKHTSKRKSNQQQQQQSSGNPTDAAGMGGTATTTKKKKSKKAKFAARNARCWIYVTGLPSDTTTEEVVTFFSRAGILDLDPETQKPKVKLYRDRSSNNNNADRNDGGGGGGDGACKGDASICYARPESVELAITLFDEAPFRPTARTGRSDDHVLRVERAKFEQRQEHRGDKDDGDENGPKRQSQQPTITKKRNVSEAKWKVAKMAARQAMDWDDGEFNGRLTGGLKGLRIVVLKHLFRPADLSGDGGSGNSHEEDGILRELEGRIRAECGAFGDVEKITLFSRHPEGVVIVKFAQPGAASDAVRALNGREWQPPGTEKTTNAATTSTTTNTLEAIFWDGVTDYTVRDEAKEEEEMKQRHEEFGSWLEQQQDELPEELRLQTE